MPTLYEMVTLRAPAKVNLYLKVLGRRKDGYHNIETVFERIALCDRIALRSLKNGEIKILCDNPAVPTDKKSLIYRAVERFKKEFCICRGVEARIFKKIPIAAGLGGASTDAASVITGLCRLWKLAPTWRRLAAFAGRLGADIPFFLSRSSFAAGKGIGDEIIPLPFRKKFWHLVVCFPRKLLSGDIYNLYSAKYARRKLKKKDGAFYNDLEWAVFEKEPMAQRLVGALKNMQSCGHSLVSGSGPSVFGLFQTRKEAHLARKFLITHSPFVKDQGWKMFIVPTL